VTDPLTEIENEKAQVDLGTTAHRIYRGARQDGASRLDALVVAAAFFYALARASTEDE
jgi:hypothetical protein